MKKVLAAFAALFMLSACDVTTAATIGSKLVVSIIEAKKKHPDDFDARARFYAQMYCEMRDEYSLSWSDVRQKVSDKGIPEWMISTTKAKIDKECGNEAS